MRTGMVIGHRQLTLAEAVQDFVLLEAIDDDVE
jgi:hypothetical protein